MEETTPQKNSHDISIALIQKDIEYIKKSVESVTTTLAIMDKNFVRHDELITTTRNLDAISKALESKANHADIVELINKLTKVVEGKVEIKDFDPIKTTLYRINWMLIAAVVGGILYFIFGDKSQ